MVSLAPLQSAYIAARYEFCQAGFCCFFTEMKNPGTGVEPAIPCVLDKKHSILPICNGEYSSGLIWYKLPHGGAG
jgi:hypothetical protein